MPLFTAPEGAELSCAVPWGLGGALSGACSGTVLAGLAGSGLCLSERCDGTPVPCLALLARTLVSFSLTCLPGLSAFSPACLPFPPSPSDVVQLRRFSTAQHAPPAFCTQQHHRHHPQATTPSLSPFHHLLHQPTIDSTTPYSAVASPLRATDTLLKVFYFLHIPDRL